VVVRTKDLTVRFQGSLAVRVVMGAPSAYSALTEEILAGLEYSKIIRTPQRRHHDCFTFV